VTLQFTSPKLVKYWNGSAWAESQDFGSKIKIWNGSAWQYVDIRLYADVNEETQTVTVGSNIFKDIESYGYSSGFYGSISDGTFGLISEATITNLSWNNIMNALNFTLAGNIANSGWSSVTINGITYNRSSASYNYNSENNTTSWSIPGANPFGTTNGATRAAVFTA
jgi:hypothetical protein